MTKVVGFVLAVALSGNAFAWGERGHDLAARVAARLIIQDDSLTGMERPFAAKEHLLGHLANIPDTLWRNESAVGKEARDANSPTHYVDLEYLSLSPAVATLPRTTKDSLAAMVSLCASNPKGYVCPAKEGASPKIGDAGTSPWRIAQLIGEMTKELKKAGELNKAGKTKEATASIDQAILFGGIAAHFIADMANPFHSTRNYDGWETDQGGVHKYIESDLVDAFGLDLDQEVFESARKTKPRTKVLALVTSKSADSNLDLAWALAVQSFSRLSPFNELDLKHAVKKKGRVEKGLKIPAERKPPAEVAPFFRALLVERLAMASDILAYFWEKAWTDAGKPDLSGYASWEYPHAPAFITTNY